MATKAKAKAVGESRTYRVLDALDRDGEHYGPGDTITLTEDEAAPLIAVSVIGEGGAPAKTES